MGLISLKGFNENNSYSSNSKCLLADRGFFQIKVVSGQNGWLMAMRGFIELKRGGQRSIPRLARDG
ncbi:hypothetical protein NF673_22590 [Pseudomonas moraviensis]|jgi:hypothetical protein|uniref:hypothetical protein n=1 Tax=Pseudomonas moraviensis TaxID=321662 RepID=UPI00209283E8|nr:hypothetical protein [Pseudomonas moraviensis]UST63375.1 hypothetical protein NF673_22590 [Pseudomonas moraviensis]